MRFNPATDNARTIDELAAETRAVLANLPAPPLQRSVLWDCTNGGWTPTCPTLAVANG